MLMQRSLETMLNKAIQDAINNQIRDEFYASHLYLSMAAYFEDANLPGCAQWMRVQSEEEREHAMKFFDYINDRGGRVLLQGISEPMTEFQSPLAVFQKALEHEQRVTASINAIYDLAVKENDYATQVMLNWFIEEQVEEEKSASDVIGLLQMAGESGHALVMLDRQLGARKDD
jgi:ferritin